MTSTLVLYNMGVPSNWVWGLYLFSDLNHFVDSHWIVIGCTIIQCVVPPYHGG